MESLSADFHRSKQHGPRGRWPRAANGLRNALEQHQRIYARFAPKIAVPQSNRQIAEFNDMRSPDTGHSECRFLNNRSSMPRLTRVKYCDAVAPAASATKAAKIRDNHSCRSANETSAAPVAVATI